MNKKMGTFAMCLLIFSIIGLFTSVKATYGMTFNQQLSSTPTPTSEPIQDCLMPCWNDLIDQEVNVSQVLEQIRNMDWEEIDLSEYGITEPQYYAFTINSFNREEIISTEDRSASALISIVPESLNTQIDSPIYSVAINMTSVGKYTVQDNENLITWNKFKPSQLLTIYEFPDKIWINTVFVTGNIGITLRMYWEHEALLATYILENKPAQDDPIIVCFNIEDVNQGDIVFYPNEDIFDQIKHQGFDLDQEMTFDHLIDINNLKALSESIFNEECIKIENKFIHNE